MFALIESGNIFLMLGSFTKVDEIFSCKYYHFEYITGSSRGNFEVVFFHEKNYFLCPILNALSSCFVCPKSVVHFHDMVINCLYILKDDTSFL